jgi:hypothetical protein
MEGNDDSKPIVDVDDSDPTSATVTSTTTDGLLASLRLDSEAAAGVGVVSAGGVAVSVEQPTQCTSNGGTSTSAISTMTSQSLAVEVGSGGVPVSMTASTNTSTTTTATATATLPQPPSDAVLVSTIGGVTNTTPDVPMPVAVMADVPVTATAATNTTTNLNPNLPLAPSSSSSALPLPLSLPLSLLVPSAAAKKKTGRPRKSTGDVIAVATADATLADGTTTVTATTVTAVPKKSSKFKAGNTAASKFKKNKRRASASSTLSDHNNSSLLSAAQKAQKRQRFGLFKRQRLTVTVADASPDRLVNPLMEVPGETTIQHTTTTGTTSLSSSLTTTTTAGSSLSLAHPPRAGDLLALLDLRYPAHVDTYSLAYMARVLGFSLPTTTSTTVPPTVQSTTTTTTAAAAAAEKQHPQPQHQQSRSTLTTRPMARDENFRLIPKQGTFCQNVWLRENADIATTNATAATVDATIKEHQWLVGSGDQNSSGIADMDPLYRSLLQQPPVHATPVTAAQQARLLQTADGPAAVRALQPVMMAAREYLTSLVVASTTATTNTTTADNDWMWSWQSIQEFGRQHAETHRLWSPQTQNATGLFLLDEGALPVGLVAYQFQWVPVVTTSAASTTTASTTSTTTASTTNVQQQPQQQQQSQTESLPLESSTTAPTTTAVPTRSTTAATSTTAVPTTMPASTSCELILCLKDLLNTTHSFLRQHHQQQHQQHQEQSKEFTDLPLTEREECILLLLTALCLEHARVNHVWYAVLQVSPQLVPFFQRYFCMTVVPSPAVAVSGDDNNSSNNKVHDQAAASSDSQHIHMVCDLHRCSYRYAFLLYRQDKSGNGPVESLSQPAAAALPRPQRWLVRLPNAEDTMAALQAPDTALARPKRAIARKASPYFVGATGQQRQTVVRLRAKLPTAANESSMQIVRLDPQGTEGAPLQIPTFYTEPSLDILRNFALPHKAAPTAVDPHKEEEQDELVRELIAKQRELEQLEKGLEPTLRMLLGKVVDERMEYESSEAMRKRQEEKMIMLENQKMLERRKEMDMAWQKQLEQDMDAVCDICNDGEVAPDNQILFCESCNVAVHQMCYGIDHVPEGDYYCLACRHLGRNRGAVSRDPDAPKVAAAPLPICCELCPLKQGAFMRTNMNSKKGEEVAFGKWVHVICAKWQGLNFVDSRKPDLIEDVAELKMNFRRYGFTCQLCEGDRGAMNQCRFDGCTAWIHVTCARASGTCDVVHGENASGPVETNPWSLMCPEHSDINPSDVPKDAVKTERLIAAAKEFPPEPLPAPPPLVRKPFNAATGKEREVLLAHDDYEQELLEELLTKKLQGVRCEVCDQCEENGKFLNRCSMCYVVVCDQCTLDADEAKINFKCSSCSHMDAKRKEGEEADPPKCVTCYQKGGLLRRSSATPGRKSHWSQNPKEYKKSLFGREIWTHSVCSL